MSILFGGAARRPAREPTWNPQDLERFIREAGPGRVDSLSRRRPERDRGGPSPKPILRGKGWEGVDKNGIKRYFESPPSTTNPVTRYKWLKERGLAPEIPHRDLLPYEETRVIPNPGGPRPKGIVRMGEFQPQPKPPKQTGGRIPASKSWTKKLKLEKGALPGYHGVEKGQPVPAQIRHAVLTDILKSGKDPIEMIRRLNVLANLNVNRPVAHRVFRDDLAWVQSMTRNEGIIPMRIHKAIKSRMRSIKGGTIDDGIPPYGSGETVDPRYVHPADSDYRRHTSFIKDVSRQQPRYSDGKTPYGYFEGAQNIRSGYRRSIHVG